MEVDDKTTEEDLDLDVNVLFPDCDDYDMGSALQWDMFLRRYCGRHGVSEAD